MPPGTMMNNKARVICLISEACYIGSPELEQMSLEKQPLASILPTCPGNMPLYYRLWIQPGCRAAGLVFSMLKAYRNKTRFLPGIAISFLTLRPDEMLI